MGSIFAAILLAELASRYRYHRERDELVNDEKHGSDWFYYMYEDVGAKNMSLSKEPRYGNKDPRISRSDREKAFGMHPKRHFRLNFEGIEKFCNRSVSPQVCSQFVRNGQNEKTAFTRMRRAKLQRRRKFKKCFILSETDK